MKAIPADLAPVLAALFAYSFGPIDFKFEGLTAKEKEVFGNEATFNRLLSWAENPPEDTRADDALAHIETFADEYGGDDDEEPEMNTVWDLVNDLEKTLGR